MNDRAVRALVRLEVRRGIIVGGKLAVWFVPLVLVAWMMAWISPAKAAFALVFVGSTWLSVPALTFFRYSLDGTMELLSALPVQPRDLAWARVGACAALAAPGAVLLLAAILIVWPGAELGVGRAQVAVPLLVGLWVAGTVASSLVLGMGSRFSGRTATLVVFGTLFAVASVVERMAGTLPQFAAIVRALQERGWLPAVLTLVGLVSSAGLLLVAHALIASAIRRFRPGLEYFDF